MVVVVVESGGVPEQTLLTKEVAVRRQEDTRLIYESVGHSACLGFKTGAING